LKSDAAQFSVKQIFLWLCLKLYLIGNADWLHQTFAAVSPFLLTGPALGPLEAQNCAALAALHLLQALDAAVLTSTHPVLPTPPKITAAAAAAPAGDSAIDVDAAAAAAGSVAGGGGGLLSAVQQLWPGQGGGLLAPAPGLIAKVRTGLSMWV
jgi:hypothetical protein